MSTLPPPVPTYLQAGRVPIFGMFHPTETGAGDGTAILLCPPFGWEEVCSYRSRRRWAEELAGAGHAALRIDLPGSCDSGGSSTDPGLLAEWVEGVTQAAEWLRSAGYERIVAIGIGLGGMLACRATADGAPIDELVLWSVPARGRTMVRELRAFALLNPDRSGPDEADPPPPEGSLETGGFLLDVETAADLSKLDLAKLDLARTSGHRTLLIEREGIEVDARLRGALESAGALVSVVAGPDYGAMMAHPQDAKAPVETIAVVGDWIAAAPDLGPASVTPSPPVAASAEFEVPEGGRVRETPIFIEQPGGHLFGILAEPVDRPRAGVTAVLLNAGALRRIGPGRMWVEIARRWAARGIPTFRLDVEGIGDSTGDASAYGPFSGLYKSHLVDQAIAALDELSRRDLPGRMLLCGLCSGAYWSLQAALRDDRVVAAYVINPRVLVWDGSLTVEREALKGAKVVSGSVWRRVLRGEVPVRRVLAQILATAIGLIRLPAMLIARRKRLKQVRGALRRLSAENRRVLMIFGEREPLREELERDGVIDEVVSLPGIDLHDVPGRNHSLEPMTAQRRVHDLLDLELETELAK